MAIVSSVLAIQPNKEAKENSDVTLEIIYLIYFQKKKQKM